VKSSYVLTSEFGGRATHTVIELSFHLESNVALATQNRFSSGLDPLLELNQKLVFRVVADTDSSSLFALLFSSI
jgi:hypothetical protein